MSELSVPLLSVDVEAHRVWRGAQEIVLSNLEYTLLQHLAKQGGAVIAYGELWRLGWGDVGVFGKCERDAVREALKRLRRKLEDDPKQPNYLITVRGRGVYLRRRTVKVGKK